MLRQHVRRNGYRHVGIVWPALCSSRAHRMAGRLRASLCASRQARAVVREVSKETWLSNERRDAETARQRIVQQSTARGSR